MLTKQTAALAFGALAFSPSPTSVEGFSSRGRPIFRRTGGDKHQRAGVDETEFMRSNQGLSSCSPLEAVSAWSSLHLQEHNKHQQQRRRRRLVSLAGSRVSMTLSAGAPLKEQDPASRSRPPSPSTSQGTHLDDFTYVAAITGGVPDFLEAMDQSLSGDLVTVVTYMPWCRSCHHLRHHLRMIAKAHAIAGSGAMFYEIDLDANREVHKMLDIHAAPTVLLYSSGQLVDEFTCSGASGHKVLLRHIEEQVGSVPDLRHADTSSTAPASPTPGTTEINPLNTEDA
ncbi:unnamed protein product [Ascophyllum nodosum]